MGSVERWIIRKEDPLCVFFFTFAKICFFLRLKKMGFGERLELFELCFTLL